MKTKFFYILFCLFITTSVAFADDWEKLFISKLVKGKQNNTSVSGGLGYHPTEEKLLGDAIKEAITKKGPACEIMKIAIDLKYSPYSTIKLIYSYGDEVLLDQICMCATESGITKQVITKAAIDAVSIEGKPLYNRDEIAQAQCFGSRGLGYTDSSNVPPRIEPPENPKPFSISAPQ